MTGNRSDIGYAKINFFYHPDHLGSTSMVTDAEGYITQNVSYIPYGEVFVEERNGVWNTPYLFNAKELDEETGMYYYGARYLNPKDTRWISVDPLFEKYVGMSPYNYCAGNPVRLVDVDGENWCEREVDGVTEIYYDRDITTHEQAKKAGVKMYEDGHEFNGYKFYNDHKKNRYGKVYGPDNNQITTKLPLNGNENGIRYTVFPGVTDDCLNPKTLHNNLFGTSYTGPDNPQSYGEDWNYDYQPYNNVDELGSITHDLAYDEAHVAGVCGALFSTKVLQADKDLVMYNLRCADNALLYSPNFKTALKSVGTAIGFSVIVGMKTIIKLGEDIYDSYQRGYSNKKGK